ncbi:MAG: protein-glutamate O-methyltransferase [Halieaceae bacterium]|jgi:chemotaxis protein methyltransferase CheR|nr:protein-glutamate O-methyltransferase [Halieaceae bacterium]
MTGISKSSGPVTAGASSDSTAGLMGDQEFNNIRAVIKEMTGISMGDSKRLLVQRRLSTRLKATGITTIGAYIEHLKTAKAAELEAFTNAVTTNLTSFFRENHHFEFLRDKFLPGLAAKGGGSRRLRIWSAGCSTGEEPYSLAMTLQESLQNLRQWDAKILATDLDSDVLKTCKGGIYAQNRVDNMSESRLKRWFIKSSEHGDDVYSATRDLRDLIVFNQLNLMKEWPMRGKFSVIFCRNVVIYFDKPTQRILMDRYANAIEDGGYLILGHSESLNNVSDRFELVGQTIYRKIM